MVSYRQWNMMDETWLVNRVKERLAVVAPCLESALASLQRDRSLVRSYVLPDFVTSTSGWVLEEDAPPAEQAGQERQLLVLGPERFALGEALFRPSDLGLAQAGLAEGSLALLSSAPPAAACACPGRVVVCGGTAQMPGFPERLLADLRCGLPEDVPVRRAAAARAPPPLVAWTGAARFAKSPEHAAAVVARAEYEEHGAALCFARFAPYL
jgi:actin-related protein 6